MNVPVVWSETSRNSGQHEVVLESSEARSGPFSRRASLDKLMKLCRCCMALFQRASSFVTGSARCHGQLPIAHPAFASSRAWLADSCGMQKHAGFILNSVAKQLHGTRMATTRIHFGLCANVKVLIAVSRRELSGDVTSCASNPGAEIRARRLGTRG